MSRTRLALSMALAVASLSGFASSASAASVHFGCSSGSRTIAASAIYSSSGSFWYVDRIDYSYSNSGGGKTDTAFTVYNGSGAAAWSWHTPDDRTNRSYTKSVATYVAKGNYARAYQKTWFDVWGDDPSCARSGYFQ